MYNIFDKSNVFYCYNHSTNTHSLIGDRNDFVNYIAKSIRTNDYNDTSRWYCSLLEDQNITMNDTISNPSGGYWQYPEYIKYLRQITYYDGYYRIVNIRDYLNEAFELIKQDKIVYKRKTYKKRYINRHYHCGNKFKNKMPKTMRTKRYNSIPDYKSFVRQRDKEFPNWWDDTSRRVSCCWKDQYKCKKQWGHKKHITKNIKTIRKLNYEEKLDVDLLLENDFFNI